MASYSNCSRYRIRCSVRRVLEPSFHGRSLNHLKSGRRIVRNAIGEGKAESD
jgi:hypothetical protein